MSENWTHIPDRDGNFSEVFLYNLNGNKLKVEVNREKRQIKIHAENSFGDVVESNITNGVVLEEKLLIDRSNEDVTEHLKAMSRELSSLPDKFVIRMIGGNYGVFTEFIGKIRKYAQGDVQLLKKVLISVKESPIKFLRFFTGFWKELFSSPTFWDFTDLCIIFTVSYAVYLINFNYAVAGVVALGASILSGYWDWLLRRREPYVIKVLLTMIPTLYVVTLGLHFQ